MKNVSNSSAREATQLGSQRGLASRAELNSLIAGNSGPINNDIEARKWLDTKGWVLAEEEYDRSKMVKILLTASLLPRISTEAANTIRAVAFILDTDITDNISTSLATAVSDKINTNLSTILTGLTASQTFLEALSTQQAETALKMDNAATLVSNSTGTYVTTSQNLTALVAKTASSTKWPLPTQSMQLPNVHDPNASDSTTKLQQRLLLAARSVFITVDHANPSSPRDRTPPALQKIKVAFNKAILDIEDIENFTWDADGDGPAVKTKTVIRGIQALDKGYLIDMDTPESANRLKAYIGDYDDLLPVHLGNTATLKRKIYNLIFKFVPCQGEFDPSDINSLLDIEQANDLTPGSIVSATWIKRPDRRSPNQKLATLKVTCSSPESANHLLCEKVFIAGHVVTIRKDLREPTRCNKCQEYGHIRIKCPNDEICAYCTSKNHTSDVCPPDTDPKCRSCGPTSTHPSYSRNCDTLIDKRTALDLKFPENNMPYFQTAEPWTWAMAPPKHSTDPPVHRPRLRGSVQLQPYPGSQRRYQPTLPDNQQTLPLPLTLPAPPPSSVHPLPQRPLPTSPAPRAHSSAQSLPRHPSIPPPPPPPRRQVNLDQFFVPSRPGSQSQRRHNTSTPVPSL